MKKITFIIGHLLLITFLSCDFNNKKHVIGNYFIIENDTKKDFTLSYKLSTGDFIGKAPGQLLQYGLNDTFLVAKTQQYNDNSPLYYIIDMTKDSEFAHEEIFRIGPITEIEYNKSWKQRLNIELKNQE